jgi:hypothetical protein
MKRIPHPQKIPQERTGNILLYLPVIGAHAGGSIKQQDEVGRPRLPKGKKNNVQAE